jgi:hypothetical protein
MEDAELNGVHGSRATGAVACVVEKKTKDFGRPPKPFGFVANMHSSHLVGRVLGGSSKLDNLVPLWGFNNSVQMLNSIETATAEAVSVNHEAVYYSITPLYDGKNPVPWGIYGVAIGDKGFKCEVIISNNPGRDGQRASC